MKNKSQNQGVALVITLAVIAMLTFLVVAFFSRTVANLQIESASTGNARADILAKSASEIIVGDFKAEIVAGSTPITANDPLAPVYVPLASANAIPAVSRYTGFTAGDLPVFANLVKQSTGRFFPAANYPNAVPIIQAATELTTDIRSQNSRAVINKRWDNPADTFAPMGPLLLVSPPNQTDSRFTTSAMLPHWVMMTRQGVPVSQAWTTDWKNYASDNSNAAIGRFAYNVYDTGGLIDVNSAGYPESGSAMPPQAAVGQKGTLGFAQLSLIPGIDTPVGQGPQNATKFTSAWRNLASATNPQDYLAYLGLPTNGASDLTTNRFFMWGPANGFKKSVVGTSAADNRLLGRQDLIRLAIKVQPGSTVPTYGLSLTSLAYLTHFSRETNAPSWAPMRDASDATWGGNNGTASSGPAPYAYKTNANNALVPNRFFPKVRVATAGAGWMRLTGENTVAGEPLLKYRFPLSWLALLQRVNPDTSAWDLTPEAKAIVTALDTRRQANGGTAMPGGSPEGKAAWLVQQAFGLTWNPNPTDQKGARWDYTGSTAGAGATVLNTIELLGDSTVPGATVVNENREPNFFELLKAGILSGSLGNSSDFESMCVNIGEDSNPDYHVIQIGANIISQSTTDSYPTCIAFGVEMDTPPSIITPMSSSNLPKKTTEVKVFAGIEDVPYMHSFVCTPYRIPRNEPNLVLGTDPGSPNQNTTQDSIDAWLQFVLWKPQQPAVSSSAPKNFRILFTGSNIHVLIPPSVPDPGQAFPTPAPGTQPILYGKRETAPVLSGGTNVTFVDSSTDFRAPAVLGGASGSPLANTFFASQPQGRGTNPNGSVQLPRGMWLGETYRPEQIFFPPGPNATAPATQHTELFCGNDSRFDLQYQDSSLGWHTYQRYDGVGIGTGISILGRGRYGYADNPTSDGTQHNPTMISNYPPAYCALDIGAVAMSSIDPRSQRFGLLAMYVDAPTIPTILAPSGMINTEKWKRYLKQGWAPASTVPYNGLFGPSGARFNPNWNSGTQQNPWGLTSPPPPTGRFTYYPVVDPTNSWADNPAGASTYYKDPDGVVRRGDGDSVDNVRPIQLSLDSSGNPVPSDPQNLGIVMNRPFRSVGELSYAFRDEPYKSLNLFTDRSADSALLDLFSVTPEPAVVAGKVNLNTRVPAVLQAVIAGASRQELSPSNTISAADALTIATNLVNNTSDTSGNANTGPLTNPAEIANRLATILPVGSAPADQDHALKTRREVVGRALAGSGQTRTWNFLVDVIAQSGRYTPNATQSSQFVVEGEKRYWLHVAIDRYTGQVIDQQLEPVME